MALTISSIPKTASYWLATESPNNFVFQRRDMEINSSGESTWSPAGSMRFYVDWTGDMEGHIVAVHNAYNDTMYVGNVVHVPESGEYFDTDIPYDANFDGDYFNDHTLYNGYYVECRLTINGALHPITLIASPNQSGVATVDVSGLLRIAVSLGKLTDYSETIMAETNKSGKFTLEYREQWYGAANAWTAEGNTWYYAECVRSADQGSNIYEYVPSDAGDAPFFNAFTRPVYFVGLPFDISFVCPEFDLPSPSSMLRATIKRYNAANVLLATDTYDIDPADLMGHVCSLEIDPATVESSASYLTAEIEII